MKIEELSPLFDVLEKCKTVIQSEKWHPEGSAYNHSIQCFNHAIKETDNVDLILAALFHDLGKSMESHGHEQYSVIICKPFLSEKSLWLIRMHMKINLYLDGIMKRPFKIKEMVENPWYNDLLDLNKWDKAAREANYVYEDELHKTNQFTRLLELLEDYHVS